MFSSKRDQRCSISRVQSCAMIFAVAICPVGIGAAVAGDLPSGAEVMDTYIKNTGGKSIYKKVKNRVVKMTMSTQAMTAKITQYTAAPDKLRMVIETDVMGKIDQGYNDGVAWMMNPMMGAMILPEGQADQVKKQAHFYSDIEWRKVYDKAECTEETKFEGETCYKVVLTPKEGDPETRFYEKDTGLLLGQETVSQGPMGTMTSKAVLSDYKEVGGILYPHKIVNAMGTNTMTMTFESIKTDTDIPADTFKMPEEVAKKIAEQKAAESGATEKKD
jgi:zinc protease